MKIKVSDFIADFFASKEITQVFTVVGGGAMHLNDSFGHHKALKCTYVHHEQAASMAAEAYARVNNVPALVCVTSGPGAINALNGVAGAYQDSIPMIIVSGQTKTTLLTKNSGLKLRTLGNQEFDIVSALSNMTKYAETIMKPEAILFHLEKAYQTAINGRPGPCWLDIPLDIQGAYVEEEELEAFCQKEFQADKAYTVEGHLDKEMLQKVYEKYKTAQRPVLYAGNGIRLSGGIEVFRKLVEKLRIPVVTCWDSIDLVETNHPYYCGRGGIMGDRAGNFAVQNSDFLLCIGTRLNVYQVGYQKETWARESYVVAVDVDQEELKKQTVRIDFPICADATKFMTGLLEVTSAELSRDTAKWVDQCVEWRTAYPVVQKKHYEAKGVTNVYAFIDFLSRNLPEGMITVVTNGSASVVGSQSYYINHNSRFIMNCALSSMGYGLPAAVGACIANEGNPVVCLEGDGSIMMNLQELQTMVTNRLPIKLFVINNNGYHQIRQTQNNIFHNGFVGIGPDSEDLGFPHFDKIAEAFGIHYCCICDNEEMKGVLEKVLQSKEAVLCEVFVSTDQNFEPKSATKKLEDGTLVSPPLEDLYPFLPREELRRNMYISLIE